MPTTYKRKTPGTGMPKGELHVYAKLTAEKVLDIRNTRGPHKVMAAKYGIGEKHVSKIRRGKAWAHVGGPRRTYYQRDWPAPGG